MTVVKLSSAENRISNPVHKLNWMETLLAKRLAPVVFIFFGLLFTLLWANSDHSLPIHDAAWHSAISSAFRQWLIKPSQWRIDTLLPLLTTQPLYPAGVWAFNGFCKLFIGDSFFSEHVILAIHLLILNVSAYLLSMMLLGERAKASLTIFLLNSCPLILALSHVALLDLAHTAFVAAFLAAVTWWWRDRSWGRAAICGIFWGMALISKQIALFYTAPVLFLMGIALVYKRQFKGVLQLLLIGALGALFLSTWLLPNLNAILSFSHNRGGYGLAKIGFLAGFCKNLKMAAYQIVQSFSPLLSIALLLSASQLRADELRKLWIPVLGPILGVLIIIVMTFWANSEARYYAPILLSCSLLLSSALVNLSRKSKIGPAVLTAVILICLVQTALCCSQKRPVMQSHSSSGNPVLAFFGLSDDMIVKQIPYTDKGDPWKQEWLIDYIENLDLGRQSYVNLLMNTAEFNQGSLVALAHSKRSNVFMTCWRASEANLADSFKYTDEALNSMQWVVAKTGSQGAAFFDEASQKNYEEVLSKLKNNGVFIEQTREELPDGSQLILYRNKKWIWHFSHEHLAPKKAE